MDSIEKKRKTIKTLILFWAEVSFQIGSFFAVSGWKFSHKRPLLCPSELNYVLAETLKPM